MTTLRTSPDNKPRNSPFPIQAALAVFFVVLAPLTTFLLLWLKGLPPFAQAGVILLWVYSVSWIPALLAGLLLASLLFTLMNRTGYFHRPYDFGRSFSLGAISGALSEALSTWLYRAVSHRPFSDFWIAGAMIAGCLTGALLVSILLWQASKVK